MSQTERSQIFKKWKQSDGDCISSFNSTSKRKGLSLSKTLQQNSEQRPQSFIKLSGRMSNNINSTQRRTIKLIVRQRPESEQRHTVDKENQMRNANHQIVFGKDTGFQHLLGNTKREQRPEEKVTRTRHPLPSRQSHTVMPTSKMLHLRL